MMEEGASGDSGPIEPTCTLRQFRGTGQLCHEASCSNYLQFGCNHSAVHESESQAPACSWVQGEKAVTVRRTMGASFCEDEFALDGPRLSFFLACADTPPWNCSTRCSGLGPQLCTATVGSICPASFTCAGAQIKAGVTACPPDGLTDARPTASATAIAVVVLVLIALFGSFPSCFFLLKQDCKARQSTH